MSLEDIRKQIDRIDDDIVRLLDERARCGRQAAAAKKALKLPLRDPAREAEVTRRLAARSDGSLPLDGLEAIYHAIMTQTLRLQDADSAPCPGHAAEGKIDVRAEVFENSEIAPGFRRMRLRVPELAGRFTPGQFFQLRLDSGPDGAFLRRPFAPSEYTDDGFVFIYGVVGEGTRLMARLRPGARVSVLAPLGNAYTPLPSGACALVVGGGCGGPSLAPLAARLTADGVKTTVVLGARTATAVLEHKLFAKAAERVVIATDDGSHGCRGTVVDAYRQEIAAAGAARCDRIYSCGPHAMLRAVAALAAQLEVPCEVSLEERMACGFGACMGCAVAVRDSRAADGFAYRRVCHDGPVFDARDLLW